MAERAAWYGPCREAYHGLVEGLRERSDPARRYTVDKSRYPSEVHKCPHRKGQLLQLLSFDLQDPTGYGRVIRDGLSVRIVEHKDATPMKEMP